LRCRHGNGSPLLFPGERGGHLDIHHFRLYQWRPAQKAAGITPTRRVYDLRHTFATFASLIRSRASSASLERDRAHARFCLRDLELAGVKERRT
jgi:integrase